MICAKCQAAVPEESTFCLRCGTRLVALERLAPVNGGKAGHPAAAPVTAAARPAGGESPRPAGPKGREAYALSFKALADERVRYRVARWLCEIAPAHHLPEVQADLSAGAFATFLALTPAEADATRQRIEALGAHPALWQLRPASVAEMLLPERQKQPAGKTRWTPKQQAIGAGIAILVFFLFALFSWNQYMRATSKPPGPGGVPRIGGAHP